MSARALALGAAALTLGGCGGASADLFSVTRTPVPGGGAGSSPRLSIVVRDDGSVSCDGHRKALPGSLLLDARQLQRDLNGAATQGEVLTPGPRPVFSYAVRTPAGGARFADDSAGQPPVFQRLAYFTLQVDRRVCGGRG